jgi:hypothetical protein
MPSDDESISEMSVKVCTESESGSLSSDALFEDFENDDDEERITGPRQYFQKLEALEREVYQHSAMSFYRAASLERNTVVPFLRDELILPDHRPIIDRAIHPFHPFHLIQCRNVVCRASANVQRLRAAGFCGDNISLLILSQNPSCQVARLVSLSHTEVEDLAVLFIEQSILETQLGQQEYHKINIGCGKILTRLGPRLSDLTPQKAFIEGKSLDTDLFQRMSEGF